MSEQGRHLVARIDTAAIAHNCRVLRGLIPAGCRICAVVKCNAYGHGMSAVLPALQAENIEMLCVGTVDEARELIALHWTRPILMLGSEFSIYSDNDKADLARWLVENDIRITATRAIDIKELIVAAESLGKPAVIHLMLDSGMCRMGLNEEDVLKLIAVCGDSKALQVEGLYTHLATADERDKDFARRQLQRFTVFINETEKRGLNIPIIHAANSAGTIDIPESRFNMIRPGIAVYGCHSSLSMRNRPDFRPAMKVVSFLTLVKQIPKGSLIGYGCTHEAKTDMTIGLVPVGYGDGYDRRLSNAGVMTVLGKPVTVIGRVSMDQTIVDLTEIVREGMKVCAGQEVTVIDNVREQPNSVESLARRLGTVPHEIVTKLNHRVKRVAAD